MIAIGKKHPEFENRKRKAAMPSLLMVSVGKEKAPPEDEPEPEEPITEAAEPEPDGDESIQPNPAALAFRSESETCQHCSYMKGDRCSHPLINQPVDPGDSCAAFEPKEAAEPEMEEEVEEVTEGE